MKKRLLPIHSVTRRGWLDRVLLVALLALVGGALFWVFAAQTPNAEVVSKFSFAEFPAFVVGSSQTIQINIENKSARQLRIVGLEIC